MASKIAKATLTSGIIGAGMMYVLDPERGKRRRALFRDKVVHTAHKAADAADATARDMAHRARGVVAEAKHLVTREEIGDEILVERVRSRMGRLVSHPSSITVRANQGKITLYGPILAREVDDLISRVCKIRGVRDVENRLDVFERAEDIPGLQGGVARPGERFELFQTNWSPTARVLAGGTGSVMALYGLQRGGVLGGILGTAGLALAARGATNLEMKRLVGLGGGRRAVTIQKTINIAAPIDQVYGFWSNFENFPGFMTNVREVKRSSERMSHWVVSGPAGVPVEWDAEITQLRPNEVLAWKSVRGSTIGHAGIIRFWSNEDGTTTVDVKMSYNPPAGALGHSLAYLFGVDPKSQLDQDLMRMKSLIETGQIPSDAANPNWSTPKRERAGQSSLSFGRRLLPALLPELQRAFPPLWRHRQAHCVFLERERGRDKENRSQSKPDSVEVYARSL